MAIIEGGIVGTLFGSWIRIVVSASGVIIPVTGSIYGISQAAPVLEPWAWTSHAYARTLVAQIDQKATTATTQVDQKTTAAIEDQKKILRAIQLDGANGKREASLGRLAQFKIALAQAPTDGAKDAINFAIQQEQNTLDALDQQIKSLKKTTTGN